MHDNSTPSALLPAPAGRSVGGAVFLVLVAFLAIMACFKYLALHSTVVELGVFLSDVFSLHTGGQWWRAFLGHARPLLPVYAAIYRFVPAQAAPLALLILQSVTLALPALWAGKRYGMLAAVAYALYFPVWTLGLSDFHCDHLLVPVLFGFLAAATSGHFKIAFLLGLLPALVKEPFAWTTVCCGLYLWLVAGRARGGLALMVFGSLYFFVASHWLIPFCTPKGALIGVGDGLGASLAALAAHPATTLVKLLAVPDKWRLLGVSFAALLFFPLFRPKLLVPAIPAVVLCLLSTRPEASVWTGQGTAGLAGVLFFAFCEVLGPVRILASQSDSGSRHVGLVLILTMAMGHLLLAPSPVSRLFLTTEDFSFSASAYEPTARDAAILSEIIKSVPTNPTVPVVSQNTLNWGALAERFDYDSFPVGVFDPYPVRDMSKATLNDFWIFLRTGQTPNIPLRSWQADYVLLDLTRPLYVVDRGCDFRAGACQDAAVADEFKALVARARQRFETVYDHDGFLILRRPRPKSQQPAPSTPAPSPAPSAGEAAATPSSAPPAPSTPSLDGSPTPQGATPAPGTGAASPEAADRTAATPRSEPPAAASQIQVEILDRFPTSHTTRKVKPQTTPDPAVSGTTPDSAVKPSPDDTARPARPSGRHRRNPVAPPLVLPSPAPSGDATPAP